MNEGLSVHTESAVFKPRIARMQKYNLRGKLKKLKIKNEINQKKNVREKNRSKNKYACTLIIYSIFFSAIFFLKEK